jgi:hypothetical protein
MKLESLSLETLLKLFQILKIEVGFLSYNDGHWNLTLDSCRSFYEEKNFQDFDEIKPWLLDKLVEIVQEGVELYLNKED